MHQSLSCFRELQCDKFTVNTNIKVLVWKINHGTNDKHKRPSFDKICRFILIGVNFT